jgi:hypothetical protein
LKDYSLTEADWQKLLTDMPKHLPRSEWGSSSRHYTIPVWHNSADILEHSFLQEMLTDEAITCLQRVFEKKLSVALGVHVKIFDTLDRYRRATLYFPFEEKVDLSQREQRFAKIKRETSWLSLVTNANIRAPRLNASVQGTVCGTSSYMSMPLSFGVTPGEERKPAFGEGTGKTLSAAILEAEFAFGASKAELCEI